jgi:hypothetical protein
MFARRIMFSITTNMCRYIPFVICAFFIMLDFLSNRFDQITGCFQRNRAATTFNAAQKPHVDEDSQIDLL